MRAEGRCIRHPPILGPSGGGGDWRVRAPRVASELGHANVANMSTSVVIGVRRLDFCARTCTQVFVLSVLTATASEASKVP